MCLLTVICGLEGQAIHLPDANCHKMLLLQGGAIYLGAFLGARWNLYHLLLMSSSRMQDLLYDHSYLLGARPLRIALLTALIAGSHPLLHLEVQAATSFLILSRVTEWRGSLDVLVLIMGRKGTCMQQGFSCARLLQGQKPNPDP